MKREKKMLGNAFSTIGTQKDLILLMNQMLKRNFKVENYLLGLGTTRTTKPLEVFEYNFPEKENEKWIIYCKQNSRYFIELEGIIQFLLDSLPTIQSNDVYAMIVEYLVPNVTGTAWYCDSKEINRDRDDIHDRLNLNMKVHCLETQHLFWSSYNTRTNQGKLNVSKIGRCFHLSCTRSRSDLQISIKKEIKEDWWISINDITFTERVDFNSIGVFAWLMQMIETDYYPANGIMYQRVYFQHCKKSFNRNDAIEMANHWLKFLAQMKGDSIVFTTKFCKQLEECLKEGDTIMLFCRPTFVTRRRKNSQSPFVLEFYCCIIPKDKHQALLIETSLMINFAKQFYIMVHSDPAFRKRNILPEERY